LLGAGRPAMLAAAHGYCWVGAALGEVLAYTPSRACQLSVEAQRLKLFFLSRWNLGIKSIFQPDLKFRPDLIWLK